MLFISVIKLIDVAVIPYLLRDGLEAENHGALEAGKLPFAWTRRSREK